MNNITISGRIGKDIEVKTTAKSIVGKFSVADSQFGGKPSIWWNCDLWGERVEKIAQYLVKGTSVTVSGTISEDEFVNKDGINKKTLTLRVSNVDIHGGKKESSGSSDDNSDVPF